MMIASFLTLSASAHFLSQAIATEPVFLAVVVRGMAAWAFYPAQQARLMAVAGVKVAPIALSLNASFKFLCFSIGTGAVSRTLAYSEVSNLGLVAEMFVPASLLLTLRTTRRSTGDAIHAPGRKSPCPQPVTESVTELLPLQRKRNDQDHYCTKQGARTGGLRHAV
jgi:predicted MFS family arabinose efflux permease